MTRSLSVVVPCLNDAALLGPTLDSLARQGVPADEIIVVDNASTDNSAEVARSRGAYVVDERRRGVTRASATGFDAARGDVIVRLDADVVAPEDFLERVHRVWDAADISPGRRVVAATGSARFSLPGWRGDFLSALYLGAYRASVASTLGHYPVFGTNFSLRRDWWEDVRDHIDLDDSRVHDDMHFSFAVRPNETVWLQRDLVVATDPRALIGIRQLLNRFFRGFYTIFTNWRSSPPHRRLKERGL